jgi:hypothetical protein
MDESKDSPSLGLEETCPPLAHFTFKAVDTAIKAGGIRITPDEYGNDLPHISVAGLIESRNFLLEGIGGAESEAFQKAKRAVEAHETNLAAEILQSQGRGQTEAPDWVKIAGELLEVGSRATIAAAWDEKTEATKIGISVSNRLLLLENGEVRVLGVTEQAKGWEILGEKKLQDFDEKALQGLLKKRPTPPKEEKKGEINELVEKVGPFPITPKSLASWILAIDGKEPGLYLKKAGSREETQKVFIAKNGWCLDTETGETITEREAERTWGWLEKIETKKGGKKRTQEEMERSLKRGLKIPDERDAQEIGREIREMCQSGWEGGTEYLDSKLRQILVPHPDNIGEYISLSPLICPSLHAEIEKAQRNTRRKLKAMANADEYVVGPEVWWKSWPIGGGKPQNAGALPMAGMGRHLVCFHVPQRDNTIRQIWAIAHKGFRPRLKTKAVKAYEDFLKKQREGKKQTIWAAKEEEGLIRKLLESPLHQARELRDVWMDNQKAIDESKAEVSDWTNGWLLERSEARSLGWRNQVGRWLGKTLEKIGKNPEKRLRLSLEDKSRITKICEEVLK